MNYTQDALDQFLSDKKESDAYSRPVEKFLSGLSFGLYPDAPSTQSTIGTILGYPAEIAGFMAGPGKVLKPVAGALGLASKAPSALRTALTWGAEGAVYASPKALLSPEGQLSDIPSTAAEWGVMGGVGSLLFNAVKSVFGKLGKPLVAKTEQQLKELLSKESPEVQQAVQNELQLAYKSGEVVVENVEKSMPLTAKKDFFKFAGDKSVKPIVTSLPAEMSEIRTLASQALDTGIADSILREGTSWKNIRTPDQARSFFEKIAAEYDTDVEEVAFEFYKGKLMVRDKKGVLGAFDAAGAYYINPLTGKHTVAISKQGSIQRGYAPNSVFSHELVEFMNTGLPGDHPLAFYKDYIDKTIIVTQSIVKDPLGVKIKARMLTDNALHMYGYTGPTMRRTRGPLMLPNVVYNTTWISKTPGLKTIHKRVEGELLSTTFKPPAGYFLAFYAPVKRLQHGVPFSVAGAGVTAGLLMGMMPGDEVEGMHYSSPWVDPLVSVAKNIYKPGVGGSMFKRALGWIELPFWKKDVRGVVDAINTNFKNGIEAENKTSALFAEEALARMNLEKMPKSKETIAKYWYNRDLLDQDISLAEKLSMTPDEKVVYEGLYNKKKITSEFRVKRAREIFDMDAKWSQVNDMYDRLLPMERNIKERTSQQGAKAFSENPENMVFVNDAKTLREQYIKLSNDLTIGEQKIKEANIMPDNYLPHTRTGDTVVAGIDEFGELINHDMASITEIESVKKRLLENPYVKGIKTYHYNDVFNDIPLVKKLPWDMVEVLMDRAQERFGGKIPDEVKDAFYTTLIKSIDPKKSKRGNMGMGIPGWRTDFDSINKGVENAMMRSITSYHRTVGAKQAVKAAEKIMNGDDRAYAEKFIDSLYGTPSAEHSISGRVRYGLGVWYLSLKPSYAIQNMTQVLLNNFSEIANHVGITKAVGIMSKAYKDTYTIMTSNAESIKNLFPEDFVKLYEKAKLRKDIDPGWAEQYFGPTMKDRSKLDVAMTSIQKWTETTNRVHSLSAAYQIGKEKGLKGDDLYSFAVEFINNTQYPFERHSQPLILQGKGPLTEVARMAYMFRNFSYNTLHRLYKTYLSGVATKGSGAWKWKGSYSKEFGTQYGLGAKVAQTMSIAALAGVMGVPGAMAYKKLMAEKGEDVEEKMKSYISNTSFGTALGHMIDDSMMAVGFHPDQINSAKEMGTEVAFHGFPSLFNAETASWVGTGEIPGITPSDYAGVFDSVPTQVKKSLDYALKGETWKAVETSAPSTVRNFMRAYRYSKEGIRDESGELLYNPEFNEVMQKAMGVPSARETRVKDVKYIENRMVQNIKTKSQLYTIRIADAIRKQEPDRVKEILNEVMDYNRTAPLHLRITLNQESIAYRLQEQLVGGGFKGVPRQMQPEAMRMRKESRK